jgi:hypothetical protein
MKRVVRVLGNIVVCMVVVIFAICWVLSTFVELPPTQNENLEWYEISWLTLFVLAAIYTVWRLLKLTVYQLSFTVTKAIYEAKKYQGKE